MIKQFISYIRLLSLDVVFGACVSTMFVAQCLGMALPLMVVLALGIAVWVIYTFDHLLDGGKVDAKPSSPRHQFHQNNSKKLYIALFAMSLLGFAIVTQLPIVIIANGLSLVLAVVIYFGGLKLIGSKPSPYKEPLVALAYTIGVFLGPVSLMSTGGYSLVIMLFVTYLLLAQINLLIFSVYEFAIDETDQHTSLARYFGIKMTNVVIGACFFVLIALLSYQAIESFNTKVIVLISMTIVLLLIHLLKPVFRQNEWYRILGDAVFYFPIIALI